MVGYSSIWRKTGLGTTSLEIGHYSNRIFLAILYAGMEPSLWGPSWPRTLFFVTAEAVALVWLFMFPLLGTGIAATKMAAIIPLVSLVRHLLYGIPVWYFVHNFNASKTDSAII